jgi:hypothetical protein
MPKSSKNCGKFITSSRGGDFFWIKKKKFPWPCCLRLFPIVKWWIFMTKKRKKNHWSIHFIFLNIIYLNFFYYTMFIDYYQNLGIFRLRHVNVFFLKNLINSARLVNYQSCINIVCIEPHFIAFVGSNTTWSSVKLCAWCIIIHEIAKWNRELNLCYGMQRITTYSYFNKFCFNWCPCFIKLRKLFVIMTNDFLWAFRVQKSSIWKLKTRDFLDSVMRCLIT